MATNSCILAWEIPQTEEPGGLQSMGSQSVRHDLMTDHTGSILDCLVSSNLEAGTEIREGVSDSSSPGH